MPLFALDIISSSHITAKYDLKIQHLKNIRVGTWNWFRRAWHSELGLTKCHKQRKVKGYKVCFYKEYEIKTYWSNQEN